MSLEKMIYKLRTQANLSQEKFAQMLGVSHQAVQKWESGTTMPDLKNLIKMAKYFHISLDALVLDRDIRIVEELKGTKEILPNYAHMDGWESYSEILDTEYIQSMEEGLDIEKYQDLFQAAAKMPADVNKEKISDVIFNLVLNAPLREDYAYREPSTLEAIQELRVAYPLPAWDRDREKLRDRLYGAWMGRVCGCLLGKTVEGIRTNELHPLLKQTGNYPMHRYIYESEITDEMYDSMTYGLRGRCFADTVDCMPADDDTNYTVMAQEIVEKYGRDFTPYDVSGAWLALQPKCAYYTAERIAFCNFVKGYEPPASACYKNPFREWIGAQIRGDYFGYINPGDPEQAAQMAFRDASISHIKNGIYGEMFAAAMIACAAVTDSIEQIILGGLAQIPATSRLYESVCGILEDYRNGVSQQKVFEKIHAQYDEYTSHGWCHTISNAMIVAAALLYGGGDYGKSICMAVETGFDTDCNGATVGSILGMRGGIGCIGEAWTKPVNDTLETQIFGVGKVSISERAERTLKHIL